MLVWIAPLKSETPRMVDWKCGATLKVPDATLLDLKVGYTRDNWGVDLNVTNVFDKTYVSSCQDPNVCSYGEGRSFKLKAHATW